MNNQELLEFAALAAGIKGKYYEYEDTFGALWGIAPDGSKTGRDHWNPLTSYSDALKLAVKLSITVSPYPVYEYPKHSVIAEVKAHAFCPNAVGPLRYCMQCTDPCQRKQPISATEIYGDDPVSATCRAIVRVAAGLAPTDKTE